MNGIRTVGWRFWLSWVTATTLGVILSASIAILVGLKTSPIPLTFITLAGTIVGVLGLVLATDVVGEWV